MPNPRSALPVLASVLALAAFVACSDDGASSGPSDVAADGGLDAPAASDSSVRDAAADAMSLPKDAGPDVSQPPRDGGPDAIEPSDSSSGDGSSDAGDAGPPPPDARLMIVHASPALGPVRLCLAAGGQVPPVPALPDARAGSETSPAFEPGTAQALADIADLSALALTPYLLDATNAEVAANTAASGNPQKLCDDMLGSDGQGTAQTLTTPLVKGKDYWQLPSIPASTLLDTRAYLLTIVGCPGGTAGGIAECGADYDGTKGNLQIGIAQLDTTTDPGASVGVQFAHRSSAAQGEGEPRSGHAPATAGVLPEIIGSASDGGISYTSVGSAPTLFSATALAPTQLFDETAFRAVDVNPGLGALFFASPSSTPGTTAWPQGDLFASSFGTIQESSTLDDPSLKGDAGSSMFNAGSVYTFVFLGDPTKTITENDAGQISPSATPLLGLHFLAFPNSFPVSPLN